ncbi:hypothetical protein F0L74_26195 [Chitinophaga agrisoli]|uniref:Peptidyl-prolyl cis-trans isomerase n=1 Tax=Chitinophaga agrisoli TaxID=2607653 RepID=A0A5B2VMN1_9BACT|nr:FKBP-type peptidyl-prolyl cis-trans isomerase [Chitinophaga agrisoli]KAA2239686.1 hypothetical protein F0L74_26195 [Chitinophaga agrisoli]
MKLHLHTVFYCVMAVLLLAGCVKKEGSNDRLGFDSSPDNTEDAAIINYLQTNNIKATRDASGLYYQIIQYGDSVHRIGLDNVPSLIYTRRLLNGTAIDASLGTPTSFDGRKLKDHIVGWQIGLQKITKGGKIFLIIPSMLAFGNASINGVPSNAILVCELQLVDFK